MISHSRLNALAQSAASYSLAIALVLVLLWGGNFSIQKAVFNQIGPGGFLFVRYGLILPLCCIALMFFLHGFNWPKLSREALWELAKIGFIGHTVHVGLVSFGMDLSTPFSSSLILAIGPIFTLLILRFSNKQNLAPGAIAGVLIALVGAMLFMSDKLLNSASQWGLSSSAGVGWKGSLGDLVLIAAAFFFSLHTVNVRPVNERYGITTVMVYSTLLNCIPIALITSPFGLPIAWSEQPAWLWMNLLYSVFLSAFVGWILWAWINVVRGPARSAPLLYLMPPVAGAISWLAGGEAFTTIKIIGAVVALSGVALAQFAKRSEPINNPPME
jgi:drug/metabolite transporter (DMT)-like permease